MPGQQLNYNYYTYVSDDGTTYNIRASVDWAAVAAHGLAARTSGAPRFIASKSQKPRTFTYRDATTGRSKTGPVGTVAAYGAADLGDAENFYVTGLATTVSHALAKKTGEKVPTTLVGAQLPDHA
jgi:hypothetical protein